MRSASCEAQCRLRQHGDVIGVGHHDGFGLGLSEHDDGVFRRLAANADDLDVVLMADQQDGLARRSEVAGLGRGPS